MKLRAIIYWLVLAVFLLSGVSAYARTWYIKPDGTGDAPTIKAGVDSSMAGDTVLVAAGTYEEEKIVLKGGIVLISEDGPNVTKIVKIPDPFEEPVIVGGLLEVRTDIIGFWITGYVSGIFGAIHLWGCGGTYIMKCILTDNYIGIAIGGGSVNIKYNTFYGNSYGIDASDFGSGFIERNIIWDRATGMEYMIACFGNDFMNLSDAHPFGAYNFSLDPEFCGAEAGNFYLQSDSPCAPGGSPWSLSDIIGALPVGCDEVSTEQRTWGNIKSIYNSMK